MAIVGLPNVPIIEPSIIRDSQSLSGCVNQSGIGTRASSILQIWRELEDECAVNRARERGRPRLHREGNNGLYSFQGGKIRGGLEEDSSESGLINFESQTGHVNELEDRQSVTSVQSQDFGEVERKRVRNVFREWMSSSGTAAHRNKGSSARCVGDNERDRVIVVGDWIHTTSQQKEACAWSRDDKVSGIASHIEQVRNKGQLENSRRRIRKLCGRQALLDLLAKKEQERRKELLCLEGTRPVSGFSHRNRNKIQSLLRLRCYQNRRSTEMKRPSSAAESELGLLRQRQTVSGLRDGFLSRLDNNAHVRASDLPDGSSGNDSGTFRDDRSQANSANEVLDGPHEQHGPSIEVRNVAHEENDLRVNVDVAPSTAPPSMDLGTDTSANSDHLSAWNESSNSYQLDAELEARLERDTANSVKSRPETTTSVDSNNSSNDGFKVLTFPVHLRRGSGEFTFLEGRHEIIPEQYFNRDEANVHNELYDHIDIPENLNGHESSVPVDDWQEHVSEYGREWESAISNQWGDDRVETDSLHWPGDGEGHSHGALESEVEEQNDMQENYWHEDNSQGTPRDWLAIASGSRMAFDRVDTYYFSDDDNVRRIELRELVNRRRVSSLLHSSFGQSLDHLLQAYLERQTTPDDWELHAMSPHPFMSRNQESDTDQESGPDDTRANENETMLPPPPPSPLPQAHWGQGTHQTNWPRQEIHQHPATEWEIINDLRIDMAGIQQTLDNMQRMLGTCMDMQLELQRSVRQEVSATLNRSVNPSESLRNILPKDNFKWDCVRKGVCCMCSNTNIDSLLYRCGHMCTCRKCADVLIQDNGKCPMCQAPVVEVIRAYFIQ